MTLSRRLRRAVKIAVPLVAAAALLGGLQIAPAIASPITGKPSPVPAGCPWMNTKESAAKRATQLLAASSLGQKLRWLDEQAANNPAQTVFPAGIFGGGATYPAQVACTPTVVYTDGPDYVRGTSGATVYPAQIALAASFSTDLAYAKGTSQADEAFRSRKNVILGPGVSSSRTPLAGRTPEYLGEDPLLSGTMAAADINGIQNGNPDEPVMAVVKHYIANEQELDRQTSSSNIDGRTLRETYSLPFQILLGKSNPGGVMCSYNQINGAYACENPILNNLLKGDSGFQGYVTSDFGAVHSTAPSLNAGLDQELNAPKFYSPANINTAIDNGSVTIAQVDAAAFRVVQAYIAAGLFDHPLPATATTTPSTAANKAVAEQIAEKGSVLLQNTESILPLGKSSSSIAIIGQTASNTPTDGVSAATVCAEGVPGPFVRGNPCTNPVAPLDAITARAATVGATVSYNNGSDVAAAAAAAASAEVAIVFGYAKQGEFSDRTTLALDNGGDALIAAVAAANPNTVVVLETGTATTMPWLNQVKGVVEAWYPGDQQGTAIAKLLYGDVNFSGKLPMTFPKSLADTPTATTPAQYPGLLSNGSTTRASGDTSIRQVSYSEGLAIGYKWYQSKGIQPLFPFGFGLSYTSFSYSKLQLSPAVVNNPKKKKITVSFTVKNTGSRSRIESPQVYLTLPPVTGEPGTRMVGFTQVALKAGESKKVSVTIDPSSADEPLSYWDSTAHAWATAPGTYGVTVGGSSQGTLSASFTIAG